MAKGSSTQQRRAGPIPAKDTAGPQVEVNVDHCADAAKQRADVLVVGAFSDGTLAAAARAVDAASDGRLTALLERGDLDAKAGSAIMLYDLPHIAARRVLLVSLGAREEIGAKTFRESLAGAGKAMSGFKGQHVAVTLSDVDVPGTSAPWRVQLASRILADSAYRFAAPKRAHDGSAARERRIDIVSAAALTPEISAAAQQGGAVAAGLALARDLGNLPGNVCNPPYLAATARALGEEFGFAVDVLERADMEKLGMGSALSVGRASHQPCKFIVMHYQGRDSGAKPIVLVGKGVTFDTGGVSLKPGADMDEMKFDMCGAAAVFGVLKTAAMLKLPINLIGIVPAVENMPGGSASRPGDVVTSMSGQTIEILNTDAEGRLILCDALTYAERFEPACVVDVATLTGACVIALGSIASGLYANDDQLADELLQCGTDTGDRAWRMPLWDEYFEQLRSNFADMSNLGGRPAGSVTAAVFLSRYAGSYKWAHLDIAGTNALSGDAKGATGRPVPLLAEFLMRRAQHATA